MEVSRDEKLAKAVLNEVKLRVANFMVANSLGREDDLYEPMMVMLGNVNVQHIIANHRANLAEGQMVTYSMIDDNRCEATTGNVRCRLPYGHDSHRADGVLWMPSADQSEVQEARREAYERGLKHGYRRGHEEGVNWLKSVAMQATTCLSRGQEDRERATNAFVNQERVKA